MSNIFFASDTHLGHENILTFLRKDNGLRLRDFSTIEEHNETIINNWNSVVRPNDIVYHCGDVVFAPATNFHLISRLNGKKRLSLGNHDYANLLSKYLTVFQQVSSIVEFDGGVVSHIPVHTSQLEGRWKFNIHGHLHDTVLDDDRYLNVCMENINFTPVSYDILKRYMNDSIRE